ncbi:MAG: hypothetical protein KC493_16785 [Bacteriovoracaceae bacterium]|nr:hypothetical protein [Bacteriovoracaceae bacterium]
MTHFLFAVLFTIPLYAQTDIDKPAPIVEESKDEREMYEKQQEYRLSLKWRRGEYLIYDCRKRHFACVSKNSSKRCRKERDESFRSNDTVLKCAPLKKYKEVVDCEKDQKKFIDKITNKKFCLNYKKNLIE